VSYRGVLRPIATSLRTNTETPGTFVLRPSVLKT
jgi:hypothetical protein